MLKALLILGFWSLVVAFAIRSGALSLSLRMLSRIFSGRHRRPVPAVVRGGGLAGLPEGLAGLLEHQRQLEAAITELSLLGPDYQRSFEEPGVSLAEDRRRQAARCDYEDAVIHTTRALDQWWRQHQALDERARARLRVVGPVPDVEGVLRRFPWLPRQLHQVGPMHFRDDLPAFEARVAELGEQLPRFEAELTHRSGQAYR